MKRTLKNTEKADVRVSNYPTIALSWKTQGRSPSPCHPRLISRKVYTHDSLNCREIAMIEVLEIHPQRCRGKAINRKCLTEGTLPGINPSWGQLPAAPCYWLPCIGEAAWVQEPGAGEAAYTAGGGYLGSLVCNYRSQARGSCECYRSLVLEKLLKKHTRNRKENPLILQCLSITHYCQSLALSQLTKTTEKVQLHFLHSGQQRVILWIEVINC